jgi:hypothetical protein
LCFFHSEPPIKRPLIQNARSSEKVRLPGVATRQLRSWQPFLAIDVRRPTSIPAAVAL